MTGIIHDGEFIKFPDISFHTTENIYFENGGYFPNTKAVMRIMTRERIDVTLGDIMILDGEEFRIVGIRDNRHHTTVPHWKISGRG